MPSLKKDLVTGPQTNPGIRINLHPVPTGTDDDLWSISVDDVTMLVTPADGPADLLRQLASLCEGHYDEEDHRKARDQLTSVLERLQQ